MQTYIKYILTLLIMLLCNTASAGKNEGATAFKNGDYATALREYLPLAEKGDSVAQFNVGFLYYRGLGTNSDHITAMKWLVKSAEQGNAEAQLKVGSMLYAGDGVKKDLVQSYKWLWLSELLKDENAIPYRKEVEAQMSPSELKEAQKLAGDWLMADTQKIVDARSKSDVTLICTGSRASDNGDKSEYEYKINFSYSTVNGERATITDDKIKWSIQGDKDTYNSTISRNSGAYEVRVGEESPFLLGHCEKAGEKKF